MPVQCKEGRDPAAVIIVTVGKDNRIDQIQIDAERFGIPDEQIGCAGVKQQFMRAGFNVETQSVLCRAVRKSFRIF